LKDPGIDGILKLIFQKWDGGTDWINLAQNKDRWWAVVNVVRNHHIPKNAGNVVTSSGPVRFSGWTLLHRVSQSVGWSVGQSVGLK
jgi:hypothetical protein